MITVLKSKIHRIPVTQADLNYEGSISISEILMETADIVPFEKVQVVNINNGERFETYAIPVEDNWDSPNFGSFIGVNGAGARLVQPGDLLIIMSYQTVTRSFLDGDRYEPIVLTCDTKSDGFIAISDKHTCINCPLGSRPGGVSNYRRSE